MIIFITISYLPKVSRVRCQMSDSDNKAISVQLQLKLDLPTGTELGNSLPHCTYSTLNVATHGGEVATHMLLLAALLLVPLGQHCFLHLCLFKPRHRPPLLVCHKLHGLKMDAESIAALSSTSPFFSTNTFTFPSTGRTPVLLF